MKHEPNATANALALTAGIWYILCVLWVLVSRGSYMGIMGTWFHGIDYAALPAISMSFGSILIGLVSFVIFAWISGYLFAVIYNKLTRG